MAEATFKLEEALKHAYQCGWISGRIQAVLEGIEREFGNDLVVTKKKINVRKTRADSTEQSIEVRGRT